MIRLVAAHILPAAYEVLPPQLRSASASALVLAIGLQESKFRHRRQLGGPALSFWQFELLGVRGVMEHPRSGGKLRAALDALRYSPDAPPVYLHHAIEHNDVLAAVFARLNLLTVESPLPGPDAASIGWGQYLQAWRPGKPHLGTWEDHWQTAWSVVDREAW